MDKQVLAIAHRFAWRYKHSTDPHHSETYTFNRAAMLEFARDLYLTLRPSQVPERITPEQAPEHVKEYCDEAAEGYADGWNALRSLMVAAGPWTDGRDAESQVIARNVDKCIRPECECLDYCEANDPHSKTPTPQPEKT